MELADNLMNMIDDFKTDVDIKEQQLEQLLDHNKEMVEIAEVLGHAALTKKEDMAGLRQRLEASTETVNNTRGELARMMTELQHTRARLVEQCEESGALARDLEGERRAVMSLRLQLESSETTVGVLETENDDLDKTIKRSHYDVEHLRKALHDCQRMLSSSEADVDTSIKSKENLLKTFQELQNRHQVKCEELESMKKELHSLRLRLRGFENGKCINIHFLGRSIKGKF